MAGATGYSGAFSQYRENGAPRDQVDLFVEGIDGSLHRTARLNLTFPMMVSVREDSSTLPMVSDTSGLILRRSSLEASLIGRQVLEGVLLFSSTSLFQDESEVDVDILAASLLSRVSTAGAAKGKVGCLYLEVCCAFLF